MLNMNHIWSYLKPHASFIFLLTVKQGSTKRSRKKEASWRRTSQRRYSECHFTAPKHFFASSVSSVRHPACVDSLYFLTSSWRSCSRVRFSKQRSVTLENLSMKKCCAHLLHVADLLRANWEEVSRTLSSLLIDQHEGFKQRRFNHWCESLSSWRVTAVLLISCWLISKQLC